MNIDTGGYILIYPLVDYKTELWIQDNYEQEEKLFQKEIEEKKKQALEKVNNEKKKLDFDPKRDVYEQNVPKYVFDLNIIERDLKGDIIEQPPKEQEYLDKMEFKN